MAIRHKDCRTKLFWENCRSGKEYLPFAIKYHAQTHVIGSYRGPIDLGEQFMLTFPKDADVSDLVAVVQPPRWHVISTQKRVPRYLEATL